MVREIFKIEKEKEGEIEGAMKDDLVSRQSITVKDSRSLDMDTNCIYVKIEGSEEGIERATKIFEEFGEKLSDKKAREIDDKIREVEESASEGMGAIFG